MRAGQGVVRRTTPRRSGPAAVLSRLVLHVTLQSPVLDLHLAHLYAELSTLLDMWPGAKAHTQRCRPVARQLLAVEHVTAGMHKDIA